MTKEKRKSIESTIHEDGVDGAVVITVGGEEDYWHRFKIRALSRGNLCPGGWGQLLFSF